MVSLTSLLVAHSIHGGKVHLREDVADSCTPGWDLLASSRERGNNTAGSIQSGKYLA